MTELLASLARIAPYLASALLTSTVSLAVAGIVVATFGSTLKEQRRLYHLAADMDKLRKDSDTHLARIRGAVGDQLTREVESFELTVGRDIEWLAVERRRLREQILWTFGSNWILNIFSGPMGKLGRSIERAKLLAKLEMTITEVAAAFAEVEEYKRRSASRSSETRRK